MMVFSNLKNLNSLFLTILLAISTLLPDTTALEIPLTLRTTSKLLLECTSSFLESWSPLPQRREYALPQPDESHLDPALYETHAYWMRRAIDLAHENVHLSTMVFNDLYIALHPFPVPMTPVRFLQASLESNLFLILLSLGPPSPPTLTIQTSTLTSSSRTSPCPFAPFAAIIVNH
jgi:hypothetical protein